MPFIVALSAASGAAALIYELVWFQLLELSVGSTAVSLAILLATFMGGLCLGSVLFPRLVGDDRHPLRLYALIELAIGALGLLSLWSIPLASRIYTEWSGTGSAGFILRGIVAAACLLPPTILMGATLPALSRYVETTPKGVSWIGLFYGANVAGGVFGCVLTGFYLLRNYDITTATWVAALVNVAAACGAWALISLVEKEGWLRQTRRGGGEEHENLKRMSANETILIAIATSGFCALAAEAIWTRTLGLLLGPSVYTFSIILAVFLTGLGIGSTIGSLLARTLDHPRLAFGFCQLLVAAGIAWTAYSTSASLPYWPINPSISTNIRFNFQLDLARACWVLLPPTLLWGASFPLALAAVAKTYEASADPARLVARVYVANTFGAIAGALVASLLLIAWVGSQRAEQLLIALSFTAGLLLLATETRGRRPRLQWGALALTVLIAGLLISSVPPVSSILIAHGRYAATWDGKGDIVYAAEGLNASVAVSQFPNGVLTYHVAGKIQASSAARDMRLQRMLGHITTLTAADPRSVLVIGCGAGITAGAASIDPRVERLTIVEIEPLVPQTAANYFAKYNFDVVRSPKAQIRIDDGRHFVLNTRERFDAITADPLDPWVKGAANLYTKEFLESARAHLNPGGVITMYMQLFENNMDAVKSAVATFFDVFPNGLLWGNTYEGRGHDMVMFGVVETPLIDLDAIDQRLTQPDYSRVKESLQEVGMNSSVDLFSTYAGRSSDLQEWLRGATINRDRNLRMQYLAGLGLNRDESAAIYSSMLAYRRFPEGLFVSAKGRMEMLRRALSL